LSNSPPQDELYKKFFVDMTKKSMGQLNKSPTKELEIFVTGILKTANQHLPEDKQNNVNNWLSERNFTFLNLCAAEQMKRDDESLLLVWNTNPSKFLTFKAGSVLAQATFSECSLEQQILYPEDYERTRSNQASSTRKHDGLPEHMLDQDERKYSPNWKDYTQTLHQGDGNEVHLKFPPRNSGIISVLKAIYKNLTLEMLVIMRIGIACCLISNKWNRGASSRQNCQMEDIYDAVTNFTIHCGEYVFHFSRIYKDYSALRHKCTSVLKNRLQLVGQVIEKALAAKNSGRHQTVADAVASCISSWLSKKDCEYVNKNNLLVLALKEPESLQPHKTGWIDYCIQNRSKDPEHSSLFEELFPKNLPGHLEGNLGDITTDQWLAVDMRDKIWNHGEITQYSIGVYWYWRYLIVRDMHLAKHPPAETHEEDQTPNQEQSSLFHQDENQDGSGNAEDESGSSSPSKGGEDALREQNTITNAYEGDNEMETRRGDEEGNINNWPNAAASHNHCAHKSQQQPPVQYITLRIGK